ncbi:hypothetical protein D030_0302B, partial [Vibrio parahaemolyticus AQ3810]
ILCKIITLPRGLMVLHFVTYSISYKR